MPSGAPQGDSSEPLRNIFKSNELDERSVIRKFRITAADGKNDKTHKDSAK
jgi:hypothetical protein